MKTNTHKLRTPGMLVLVLTLAIFGYGQIKQDREFQIPVVVTDKKGDRIENLTKDDFKLKVNGVETPIEGFGLKAQPVNLGIILDASPSMGEVSTELRRAAMRLINQLREGDRAQIITFNKKVKKASPLTGNRILLEMAVRNSDAGLDEGSVMRDAIASLLDGKFAENQGTNAIVLITDGVDFGSSISKNELKKYLEEAGVLVYTVYVRTEFGGFGRGSKTRNVPLANVPGSNANRDASPRQVVSRAGSVGDPRKDLQGMSGENAGLFFFIDGKQVVSAINLFRQDIYSLEFLNFRLSTPLNKGDELKIALSVSRKKASIRTVSTIRIK